VRVGHSRHCLSPSNTSFYLIGYRSDKRKNPAEGIHDDIYCNSILLELGQKKLFFFSADFLEWEDEMAEEIKSLLSDTFGINRDLVLVCATHNHSSVMSYHKHWHSGVFDQDYYDYVMETVVKSYEDCQNNLTEATAKSGSQIITGYYSNRNHPGQLADNEVSIIHFINKTGEAFCGLVNWAVHATILGPDNNELTGDLPGQVCGRLGELWGFHPAFIVGAAADCSNRNDRQGDDFAELDRVSAGLAEAIAGIPVTKELEFGDIHYETLYHTIHHNMREVHEDARRFIQKVEEDKLDPDSIVAKMPLSALINKCKGILAVPEYHLDIKFSIIRLGDIQVIAFPGELGSAFGIELKEASPLLSIIAGYSNGFHHYFLPKEEYGLSFETIGTPVPKGEPEKIVEKLVQSSRLLASNK
jgi:hypothetical protein